MPTQTQPSADAIQSAANTVAAGVHDRAFFHKLAERGIVPSSEAEAQSLSDLSLKLAEAAVAIESQPEKTAENRFAGAVSAFDKLAGHDATPAEDARIKEAAQQLANDPAIFAAAETLLAAAQG